VNQVSEYEIFLSFLSLEFSSVYVSKMPCCQLPKLQLADLFFAKSISELLFCVLRDRSLRTEGEEEEKLGVFIHFRRDEKANYARRKFYLQ